MNTLTVKIGKCDVAVKEYKGKRVVTFKDIDQCHGRPEGTARKRFNDNKKHFINGTDFFKITPSEFRTAIGDMNSRQQNDVTLVTESGYLMLVKSFHDDLAWDVQRQLVNTYFRKGKGDKSLELQIKQERAAAMILNAKTRAFKTVQSIKDDKQLSDVAAQLYGLSTLENLMGAKVGHAPEVGKIYTATEIANAIGCSAQKVGKMAKANNLQTDEYGIWVLDKSPYSAKQVRSFRYNEKGKAKFKELFGK